MSDWGGGYVTDIPYSIGWYRQQSPVMMALGSIIGGSSASIPKPDDPVRMLELGCGYGYGAMALAASNPAWSVTAVDFNPAHIAAAREWAAESGLTNITFIEADLSAWEDDPAMRAMPEMDFVTMHGVWSWVPAVAQKGIVRLLAAKVRPGGLVHLSYNAMPGWQDLVGAARVIREGGRRAQGRSDTQAREGLRLLKDLIAAEAHFTTVGERTARLVKTLEEAPSHYLAHEFMNSEWAPCFFGDVAGAMSGAKLEWVAASVLTDNFPELMMTEPQRAIFNRYADPLMQELIKDMCVPRSLRHDIFVRGARRISLSDRAELLMDVNLTLVKRVEDLPESAAIPAGKAELNAAFYQPIVKSLATGAKRVRDLLELPDLVGRRDNPAEMVAILIETDMVEATLRPGAAPGEGAMRFNEVSTRRMSKESPNRPVIAACLATGTPIVTPLLAMVLVHYMREGITDADGLVRALNAPPELQEDARMSVASCLDRFLPVLKQAGVF